MDRDIPSFNRAVMDRIYAKNHELHLKRLKNIKSGISSSHKSYQKSKPSYLPHSNSIVDTNYQIKLPQYNNLKKQVNQSSKNAQIQRQNGILFQKMIKIMKRPDKNNDPYSNRQRASMNVAKQRLSMQFSKINEENRAFYHRLESQKPTIDNKKLEEQRLKNLNILKFLGKYPNHEARARASQYKTFDLRFRRMNSTSNRVFYNNDLLNNYEQDIDENGEQSLIKFRNQMVEYDRQMQKLRMQQQQISELGQNKINSTMGNFYNKTKKPTNNQRQSRQYNQSSHNTNPSNEISEIEIYEPVIPSRRKFISQGESRNSLYQQQFINNQKQRKNSKNQTGLNDDKNQQYEQELYPYHLNHPSHNIVIEDQNMYNHNKKNKKSIDISSNRFVPDESDTMNGTNFVRSAVPMQRKLNSKNSQNNIVPNFKEQEKITINNNYHQQEMKVNVQKQQKQNNRNINTNINIEETEPVPKFSSSSGHKKSNNQIIVEKSIAIQNEKSQNQNAILLYKNVVELKSLLLNQQKNELMSDIQYDLNRQCTEQDHIEVDGIVFNYVLNLINCQISIYRMFDCYKISVQVDSSDKIQMNKKRSHKNPTKVGQNETNGNEMALNLNKQLIEWVKKLILQRLQHVCEVEIPEKQGSALLEQFDYDYKGFIEKMVKIEKDYYDENEGQENRNEQQQEEDRQYGYRLVIVLNDGEDKNVTKNKRQDEKQHQEILSNQHNAMVGTDKSIQANSLTLINNNNVYHSKNHVIKQPSQQLDNKPYQNQQQHQKFISHQQDQHDSLQQGQKQNQSIPLQSHKHQIYLEALDQQIP